MVRESRPLGPSNVRRGHATEQLGFDEAIDLLPTFVEAVGQPVADHIIEGKSFLDRLRGGGRAARDDVYVYCELDYAYYRARLELGVDPHFDAQRRELHGRLFERMALRKTRVAHPAAAVKQRTDGSRKAGVIIGEW